MPYSNITITTQTNLSYIAGEFIQVIHDSNNYMFGQVVSYNPSTGSLTFTPVISVGSGTYSTWEVIASGSPGLSGTDGTSGTNGGTGSSGSAGSSGSSGSSGTSGGTGSSGSAGSSGTSGTSGTDGGTGTSGTSGTSGTNGAPGTNGTSGTSGSSASFSGTTSYVPKFTGSGTTIGNSVIYDNGGSIGINVSGASILANLHVYNASAAASFLLQTNSSTDYAEIAVRNASSAATSYFRQYSASASGTIFGTSVANLACFFSNFAGNFAIGTRNGGDLIFGTADTERARISASTGNTSFTNSIIMATSGTSYVRMGTFPNSTTNTGEAWIGRASDRNSGTMTVQLGGNSASNRQFEVVDYAWSTVLFSVGSNGNVSANGSVTASSFSGAGTGLTGTAASLSIGGNAATATSAGSVSGLTLTSSANGINPDSVTQNQIGYNTSVSLFGQTDGGLYSSAYNSSWIHQIFGDFRTGQIAIRGKNSGSWTGWRTVLDSSNYTSYAPSLTGGGASGTWSINVTGSAGSASSATYLNSSNYIQRTGTSGNLNTDFQNTPAGTYRYQGDDAGVGNSPGGTWWFYENMRHSNGGNYWGTQIAWGWEDNAHKLATRNISANSFSGWVYFLNSNNFTSYIDAPNRAGTSYYQANTWIQLNGGFGLYCPGTNGAHIYPNTASSYTTWALAGSRGGYGGIYDDYSRVSGFMYDNGGNGGVYREANGRWYWYYSLGNSCMGINTSTTSSSYGLYVSGAIYATSDITAYSDRRKKADIVTIDNALDKVTQLRGVYYTKIDEVEKGRQTGVIAQETETVFPEVVTYAEDVDQYGVAYGNFAGLFIEAFKEQNQKIEEQAEQIKQLKQIIDVLTK